MTNNIHVNSDSVISIVGATIKGIENIQEDVNDAYSSLIDLLSDASGEEVDALREQLETENNLAIALCNTLTKFSNSIRFAASEFTELDSTGARACLKIKNCTKHVFLSPFHDRIKKKGAFICQDVMN